MSSAVHGGGLLTASQGLLIKDWGEETCVVFAPAHARTHWISAEAATVLEALSSGSSAAAEQLGARAETIEALLQSGLLRRV